MFMLATRSLCEQQPTKQRTYATCSLNHNASTRENTSFSDPTIYTYIHSQQDIHIYSRRSLFPFTYYSLQLHSTYSLPTI